MELQDIGTHSGVGIVSSLLTYLGFKQRLDDLNKKVDEIKARNDSTEEKVVYKDVHAECSKSWHMQLDTLNKKLDQVIDKLSCWGKG